MTHDLLTAAFLAGFGAGVLFAALPLALVIVVLWRRLRG